MSTADSLRRFGTFDNMPTDDSGGPDHEGKQLSQRTVFTSWGSIDGDQRRTRSAQRRQALGNIGKLSIVR